MQKHEQQELGEAEVVLEQLGRNKENKTSTPSKVSAAGSHKAQNMTNFPKGSSASKENPPTTKAREQTETCCSLLEAALEELESRSSARLVL